MIIVTGAAGFIGGNLIQILHSLQYKNIVAIDFMEKLKKKVFQNQLPELQFIDIEDTKKFILNNSEELEFIIHLGAITDTTASDIELLLHFNTNYSVTLWELSVAHQIPIIYASSAATYGVGEHGFDDDENQLENLRPLNLYAKSKHDFDKYVTASTKKPFFWVGLKFFNVYGPGESDKGKMSSMIHQGFHQLLANNTINLFKSYESSYAHGDQLRDFIHVQDIVDVLLWFMHHRKNSGIYNLGTGNAKTFNNVANTVINKTNSQGTIKYIDMPEELKSNYQYKTEATVNKLRKIGYNKPFTPLEKGIKSMVVNDQF
ncbi:MAG: ADP-L-glycero-D-manno-heptose 6-epimerase [Cyclobacteriaceae bacterium]|jgi:ADP-L-glycero-D-manno-heptose 6-epimerase